MKKIYQIGKSYAITTFLCLIWLSFYFLFRTNSSVMNYICHYFVRPWHIFSGKVCSYFRFSVAEILCFLLFIIGVFYFLQFIVFIIRTNKNWLKLFNLVFSLFLLFLIIFSLFCLFWGVYYYSDGFIQSNGLIISPVALDDLEKVTDYFILIANNYSGMVDRDHNGICKFDSNGIISRSGNLYDQISVIFPSLEWPTVQAKGIHFSRIMSYLNFTGFFCPFTGEANVNIDSPVCLLPVTIAHELAHQRGVATEDVANFVGIIACMENGDPEYVYSSALLAYIHLGNALHSADRDSWLLRYSALDDNVKKDLQNNNTYWNQFNTPVKQVSDTVYTSFLETYGETRGLRSYGACVDLLVSYYKDSLY